MSNLRHKISGVLTQTYTRGALLYQNYTYDVHRFPPDSRDESRSVYQSGVLMGTS